MLITLGSMLLFLSASYLLARKLLSAQQARVLRVLAGLRPRWTLTGGGALVGAYTKHRETRDLWVRSIMALSTEEHAEYQERVGKEKRR